MSSFSSMNYLFLKTVIGQVHDEHVNIEMQNFIVNFNQLLMNESFPKDHPLIDIITTEIVDGSYFYDYNGDIEMIAVKLKNTIVELSESNIHECQPIYRLYLQCIKEAIK